jgi:hypothetical protein
VQSNVTKLTPPGSECNPAERLHEVETYQLDFRHALRSVQLKFLRRILQQPVLELQHLEAVHLEPPHVREVGLALRVSHIVYMDYTGFVNLVFCLQNNVKSANLTGSVRRYGRVVALQVAFERQTLKPIFHLIGYRLWV